VRAVENEGWVTKNNASLEHRPPGISKPVPSSKDVAANLLAASWRSGGALKKFCKLMIQKAFCGAKVTEKRADPRNGPVRFAC